MKCLVGMAGIEPAMFLLWEIYSLLSSLAARHTYPYNPVLFLLAPCRNKLFVGVLLP